MRSSSMTVSAQTTPPENHFVQMMGHVASVMNSSKAHRGKSIAYLHRLVPAALKHGFAKVYFNKGGNAVGYLLYAYVTAEVEERFLTTGEWQLHASEWNEGDILWIIDFAAPFGNLRHILKDMRENVFAKALAIRYHRNKGDRLLCKQVDLK